VVITRESPLILASRSPRRRALLEQVGIPIEVRSIEVPEVARPREDAAAYLGRIVDEKLAAAVAEIEAGRVVLVADTEVVLDGAILGKPSDRADATRMIGELAGRSHEVMTRFAIAERGALEQFAATVVTRVFFRSLSETEIEGYASSGEGDDKAGGYAIQGLGAFAVSRIEGSYSNVVGLPIAEVVSALLERGHIRSFPFPRERGSE
jgi:septum formation protein